MAISEAAWEAQCIEQDHRLYSAFLKTESAAIESARYICREIISLEEVSLENATSLGLLAVQEASLATKQSLQYACKTLALEDSATQEALAIARRIVEQEAATSERAIRSATLTARREAAFCHRAESIANVAAETAGQFEVLRHARAAADLSASAEATIAAVRRADAAAVLKVDLLAEHIRRTVLRERW